MLLCKSLHKHINFILMIFKNHYLKTIILQVGLSIVKKNDHTNINYNKLTICFELLKYEKGNNNTIIFEKIFTND